MAVHFPVDVESHARIEAAAGHLCPPAVRADYARRMDRCTRWLLDVLAEHGATATFFIVGEVAITHPRLVRDIAEAGHEIGCHSSDHQRGHRFTPEAFQ